MTPLFKPYMPKNLSSEINKILYSGRLAYGKWGRLFEQELRAYLDTPNVLALNSHASAINVAFTTLGIGRDDEVIMSPMCCLQSTQPLLALGIRVVWADIDPNTGTLCPESVKQKITSKTKAVFHNHHLGYVGYVGEINQLAKEKGLLVIDDCIDGMGGVYQDRKIGNVGSDATVISFSAVRLPNAIDGGAVAFEDKNLMSLACKTRDLGVDRSIFRNKLGEISSDCDISTLGFAATISEINACIACNQMNELDGFLVKQQKNADKWKDFIVDKKMNSRPLKVIEGTVPVYWVFGFLSDDRDSAIAYFRKKGFYASQVHLNNNLYSVFDEQAGLTGVNEFYNKFLAVPCGWWLNDSNFEEKLGDK